MIWLTAAWAWIKKWWKWVLLPIGAGLWLLGRVTASKQVVVTSPELQAHDEARQKLSVEAAQKKVVAKTAKEERDAVILGGHSASMSKSHVEAEKAVENLKDEPTELTAYLKKVGLNARKPNS